MTATLTPRPSSSTESVAAILGRHADNPSAYLALNRDMCHFTADGMEGVIAYRLAGRSTIVQLGGVFAAPADQAALLDAFLAFARSVRRRVVAVQLMKQDALRYASCGFTVNQFGANYARALADFTLRGKKHMQLRNKISKARRSGVEVAEVPLESVDLLEVDRAWLRSKGRHVKELTFMVGETGGPAQATRRLFTARSANGDLLAYVSFSPVYGPRAGWLHDLSRRRPDAPPGVLELIVSTAVDTFRAEKARYLHFGMTPFTALDPSCEVSGASRITGRLFRWLSVHGAVIYPAADQLAYKQKWGLDLVEPEYIAFQDGISLRAVWNLLRLTNAL